MAPIESRLFHRNSYASSFYPPTNPTCRYTKSLPPFTAKKQCPSRQHVLLSIESARTSNRLRLLLINIALAILHTPLDDTSHQQVMEQYEDTQPIGPLTDTFSASEYPFPITSACLQRPRRSKFMEIDVDGEESTATAPFQRPHCDSRASSTSTMSCDSDSSPLFSQSSFYAMYPRLSLLTILVVLTLPLLYEMPWNKMAGIGIIGAKAGVIKALDKGAVTGRLQKRVDTDTDVCNRWAGQSALVNGTIYYYGGHSTTESGQINDTWSNDFFTVDLTESWDISSPTIQGLPRPSGPPAVANGFLWHSYDSLYLYGGIVSDKPVAIPEPYTLWEYQISTGNWIEHSNPKTSKGNNSEPGNQPVQQTGEGAGVSIPELGRGFYFAGHLDAYTTPGWSIQTPRIYLKSLLEYTYPGQSHDGVVSLAGGKTAGSDGVWRNVTQGGIQDQNKFPSRADGVLVHVPGFGAQGILLSIAGGQEKSFVSAISPNAKMMPMLTAGSKVTNECN